jgi:hypothetical protein
MSFETIGKLHEYFGSDISFIHIMTDLSMCMYSGVELLIHVKKRAAFES